MSAQLEPMTDTYWTELRMFLQVAQARSFHKAAQQLGLTHPTLGRAVRRLEAELGTALIADAGGRGIKLTEAGEKLAAELATFDQSLSDILRRTKGEAIETALPPRALEALDNWIAAQPMPRPTRSDALRIAVVDWLTSLGLLKHHDSAEGANGRDF